MAIKYEISLLIFRSHFCNSSSSEKMTIPLRQLPEIVRQIFTKLGHTACSVDLVILPSAVHLILSTWLLPPGVI